MNLATRSLAVLALGALAAPTASAITQDFESIAAGTVAAGIKPSGGFEPGLLFPDFQIIVHNNNGPQTAAIFDTSNPTGGDDDLGTPNENCPSGGPGIGSGGEPGAAGENCTPLGNVLIIQENLTDTNSDDILDSPDDDASGGHIVFDFEPGFVPVSVQLLDIDSESASVEVQGDAAMVTVNATDLGNNSVQTLDLTGLGSLDKLVVTFSSSGAIGAVEYEPAPTSVESETWGQVKARWR